MNTLHRLGVGIAAGFALVALVGCASGGATAKSGRKPKRGGFVRVINLTDRSASATINGSRLVDDAKPQANFFFQMVPPKPQTLEVKLFGTNLSERTEFQVQSDGSHTVYVLMAGKALKSSLVLGEPRTAPNSGSKAMVVNLLDRPIALEFKSSDPAAAAQKVQVSAGGKSKDLNLGFGQCMVTASSSGRGSGSGEASIEFGGAYSIVVSPKGSGISVLILRNNPKMQAAPMGPSPTG